jgi:hypothetical protein
LFRQTLRGFERPAEFAGDVLTVNEDALIFAQKISLRLADRFEVGNAHGDKFEIRNSKSETISNDE